MSNTSHKARILVAGVGPLPPERPDRLFAPGLRIWGIARELARAGHPVRLVCTRFSDELAATRYDLTPAAEPQLPEGLARTLPEGGLPALLTAEALEFGADAAVGSSDRMNHALAADADFGLPAWMDFFGDPMAEKQLLALHHHNDAVLDDQWALYAPALARADRISGCSTEQCSAQMGQLAAVGRLGRFTTGERLVSRIPPWIEPVESSNSQAKILDLPAEAFLIIQTGGFNTWLDPEMLFAALEKAMHGDPRIHFAATGGAIPGHYADGFQWFENHVKNSQFKDRYHLLGWVPTPDVPRLIAQGDLAVNFDIPSAEGILGTRNRLLDWLLAGVPVISTPGCELALELAEEGFLSLTPHGDPEAAARQILMAAADPGPRRAAARQASEALRRERTAAAALRPLLEWAASPKPASDLQAWRSGATGPPRLWRAASLAGDNLRNVRREAEKAAWLEQKLARMEGSLWVRLALRLRGTSDLAPPAERNGP